MKYNKLNLRNGESMQLRVYPLDENDVPNGMAIKVMKILVNDLPVGNEWSDRCEPYAIVAIDKYPDGWGWIELDGDTKDEIGVYMQDCDAEIGKWYYLVIYKLAKFSTDGESPPLADMPETYA